MATRNKDDQWYLRTGGTATFGPVSLEGLILWAEQARVLPGHEVSHDKETWMPAEQVPELRMTTYIDLGDGNMGGPFNRKAAETLIETGRVSKDAKLIDETEGDGNTAAGEKVSDDSPAPQGKSRSSKSGEDGDAEDWREKAGQLETALAGRDRELAARDEQIASLQTKLAEQKQKLAELASAGESAGRFQEEAALAKQEQQALLAALDDMKAENARLRESAKAEAVKTSGENSDLLARLDALERELADVQAQRTQEQAERDALRTQLTETENLCREREEAVKTSLAAANAERERLVAELAEREKTAKEEADAALAAANAERERLAAELAEREKTAKEEADALGAKVARLEKICALGPDAIVKFETDQRAVYGLMKEEVDQLSQKLEDERGYLEKLKELINAHQEEMLETRRSLLRRLGTSPIDMTHQAVRDRASESQLATLRGQIENSNLNAQRDMRLAEQRETELLQKIRQLEGEIAHMHDAIQIAERKAADTERLKEQLELREKELNDERRERALEQEQISAVRKALLIRVETLEAQRGSQPPTGDSPTP
ncbi:MAG: hypothetical protein J5985_09755 [Kiritimatiellae bacterium]|nr:hypothetical protein [Kiritimatiellia bacterium]